MAASEIKPGLIDPELTSDNEAQPVTREFIKRKLSLPTLSLLITDI